ncbi:MAG: 3'-5' exonuclease, partial [Bacteroidia bacterium]|nr:3'-5' exonuclease [Bacteroidia bacterium]
MSSIPVNSILFLDIETVPQYPAYSVLPDEWKALWNLKSQYILRNKEEETPDSVYPRAGIYAEFGKIICIGCGFVTGNGPDKKIALKSFYGDDEK